MTLMPLSPAGMAAEAQIGLLYGAYTASALLMRPLFACLGGRIGGRSTIILGAALAGCASALFGISGSLFIVSVAGLCQGAASAAIWTAGLAVVAEHYIHNRVEMIGYAFTGGTADSVLDPCWGERSTELAAIVFPS